MVAVLSKRILDVGDDAEGEQRASAAGAGEGSIMRMEDGV